MSSPRQFGQSYPNAIGSSSHYAGMRQRSLARLAALDVSHPKLHLPDVQVASATYTLLLKTRLNELGVRVPALPDIGVGQLFKLAIDERRLCAGGPGLPISLLETFSFSARTSCA